MELRKLLLEYKSITEDFIKVMEEGKYELQGEELLRQREETLNKLKIMSFNKEELMKISEEINLMTFEEKAAKLLNLERNKIKEEIFNLKNNRNAAKTYGVNFKNINFINKEV
ncbi:hypothetical protein [Clostridium sp.]|uniref:hypothetical protein n=1 Tax=Clostridium sp. TaxID=1506 RepID=UPI003216D4B7